MEKTDPSKIISSEVIETYGTFTGKYSLQYITDDLIILVRHYANFHSTERQRKSILICYRATLRYCGYRPMLLATVIIIWVTTPALLSRNLPVTTPASRGIPITLKYPEPKIIW